MLLLRLISNLNRNPNPVLLLKRNNAWRRCRFLYFYVKAAQRADTSPYGKGLPPPLDTKGVIYSFSLLKRRICIKATDSGQ